MNNTAQRRVILEELQKVKTHPTADEVYDMARQRIPNISMATVYRNLEIMAKKGDVIKLDIAGRRNRYDADISSHFHLRCRSCGSVSDLDNAIIKKVSPTIESIIGSSGVEDFSLEFKGLCKSCYKGI